MEFIKKNYMLVIAIVLLIICIIFGIIIFTDKEEVIDFTDEQEVIDFTNDDEDEIDNIVSEDNNENEENNIISDNSANNNITSNSNNNTNNNSSNNNNSNTTSSNVTPPKKEETKPNNTTPKKEVVSATKEYYCTGNYKLDGTKCISTFSSPALTRYYCTTGNLSGTKCNVSSRVPYSPSKYGVSAEACKPLSGSGSYNSCLCSKDGGTYDSSTDTCYKMVNSSIDALVEYYCTGDLTLSGNVCYKNYELDAMYKYTCPSGYTLVGTNCEK